VKICSGSLGESTDERRLTGISFTTTLTMQGPALNTAVPRYPALSGMKSCGIQCTDQGGGTFKIPCWESAELADQERKINTNLMEEP